ncbi:MAG: IPT/TIG domain-containing protein [Chitinophagaceae bacterium]
MKQLFIALSLWSILSCSKPGGQEPDPNPNPGPGNPGQPVELTIGTIVPDRGEFVPITINGTGFSSSIADNVVRVNGALATVTKATSTHLEITLPANLSAGDHDIAVTTNFKTVTKAKAYHLIGWIVSNFAGTGDWAHTDNTDPNLASFKQPIGIASDAAGNFYVGDMTVIRKIDPQGQVSTFARGFALVTSIAVDANNNLYVADQFNNQIKKVSSAGVVSVIAGKNELGDADGTGENARFSLPYGVAINPAGTHLYIGDLGNNAIRRIRLSDNEVVTVAGNGTSTRKDDVGLNAGIPSPGNLAFDADGNLLITEKGGGMIRKMAADGRITTVGGFETRQDVSISPTHLAFDSQKNMYVTFSGMAKVKKYDPAGTDSDFAGASSGPLDMDNGPADLALFRRPEGILVKEDAAKNKTFYVVDSHRKKIKKITKQ